MTTIIAGLVCVLAVAGMAGCGLWYCRARARTISGRINAVQFNLGMDGKEINP